MKTKKIKKLAAKFRGRETKYIKIGDGTTYRGAVLSFLDKEIGDASKNEEIAKAFMLEVSRQNKVGREKAEVARIEMRCAVYNEVERQREVISKELAERMLPFMRKKIYLASGSHRSLLFDKFEFPQLKFKRKDVKEYGFEQVTRNMVREGNWCVFKARFSYKKGKVAGSAEIDVYAVQLDSETGQTVELLKELEAAPKINAKEQMQHLAKEAKLNEKLSAVRKLIKINYYS